MNRFVLLEHQWNGVHWDLMLEREGASSTWALSGLPEAGRDTSAHGLPDHRLAYLEYEGPVSGERGHVRRVAAGEYAPLIWTEGRIVVQLEGPQFTGTLELVRSPSDEEPGLWRVHWEPVVRWEPVGGVESSMTHQLES